MIMKKLTILRDNGKERDYQLPDSRVVTIDVSSNLEIIIKDSQKDIIGRFDFRYIDDVLPGLGACYYLKWMYMDLKSDTYKYQGIGREALKFFREIYGTPIAATVHDGPKQQYETQLTGDAPNFVQKMREEGVIE